MAFNKTAEGSSMKRRPMRRRKKVCVFCGKDNVIDYKDINKIHLWERKDPSSSYHRKLCKASESSYSCYQESTSSGYDAIRLRIDLVIPRVSAFGDVALTQVWHNIWPTIQKMDRWSFFICIGSEESGTLPIIKWTLGSLPGRELLDKHAGFFAERYE